MKLKYDGSVKFTMVFQSHRKTLIVYSNNMSSPCILNTTHFRPSNTLYVEAIGNDQFQSTVAP